MDVVAPKPFRPVPLQLVLGAASKHDIKAIYRRPRREVGPFDEEISVVGEDGLPLYDLTTPLPVKRHHDWLKRGFEYVTLADRKSLDDVVPYLREAGLEPKDFILHPHFGAWNPKLYAATAAEGDRQALNEILDALDAFGIDAYEGIKKTKVPDAILKLWQKRRNAAANTSTAKSTSNAASAAIGTDQADVSGAPAAATRPPKPRATRKKAAKTPAGE